MTGYFLKRLVVALVIFHLASILMAAVFFYLLDRVLGSAGFVVLTDRYLFLVGLFGYTLIVGTASARISSKFVKKPQ